MNDNSNHSVFCSVTVRTIWVGTPKVKTDLRIFHANTLGMYTYCLMVWVVESMSRIGYQRLGYSPCRMLLPQRISFFRIIRIGHYRFAIQINCHSIPDIFPGRGKSKITHIFSIEFPCFCFFCIPLFCFYCIIL